MNERSPDMLKPTLLAGALFGTLAALPVIGLLNCACCALILSCGFFGSYLYSRECRRQGAEMRAGNGAIVGLIAGAFYSMVYTLVSAIIQIATGGDFVTRAILEWIKQLPNLPPDTASMVDQALADAGKFGIGRLIMGFLFTILVAAVFSTIGGLIGGAVFKVGPRPPEPPAAPVPEPPYFDPNAGSAPPPPGPPAY